MKPLRWLLLFVLGNAAAAPPFPITLTVCANYTVSKRGDGAVVVRCPGQPLDKPFFTIVSCPRPSVLARTANTVTINC